MIVGPPLTLFYVEGEQYGLPSGIGLLLTAGCEVQGVAYIAAGSAAGGGLRNVPGPGGRLLLNTKYRV